MQCYINLYRTHQSFRFGAFCYGLICLKFKEVFNMKKISTIAVISKQEMFKKQALYLSKVYVNNHNYFKAFYWYLKALMSR